jgi:molybdate transport system ATP-binding protein
MFSIDVKKSFSSVEMNFIMNLSSNRTTVFGPSGSGKSTLLKLMIGFFTPDYGRFTVRDKIIFDTAQDINIPVHLRKFGYLPQDYTLFPHLTIKENILYGLKARKIQDNENKFNQIVEKLGVAGTLSFKPAELSGGQQQRVALARIMLVQPRALFLDEPFSALDIQVRDSLRELVCDLVDEDDIPSLLVSHDLEEAMIFGREIVIINGGKIIEYGDRNDIFHNPTYVETAKLLGFQVWPLSKCDDSQAVTAGGEVFTFSGNKPVTPRYICIRPENIMIIRKDRPLSKGVRENLLSGVVTSLHHRARYVRIVFLSERGDEYVIHTPEHVIRVMEIHLKKKIKISLKCNSLVLCGNKL